MFAYADALSESVRYFNGDELAARVFVDKYALRDNNGNIVPVGIYIVLLQAKNARGERYNEKALLVVARKM